RGGRVNECSEGDPADGTGTALGYAIEKGYMDIAQLLVDRGALVRRASVKGLSPLHLAAALDDPGMVRFLVMNNADQGARDSDGRTPLQYATHLGYQRAADALAGGRVPARRPTGP